MIAIGNEYECFILAGVSHALPQRQQRRGMSLMRTPLRIGVDIVKNIVEKHGCFVLVIT